MKIKFRFAIVLLINDYLTRVPFRWSLAENWKTLSVLDVVVPTCQINNNGNQNLFIFKFQNALRKILEYLIL